MTASYNPIPKRVSDVTIRRIFNRSQHSVRISNGEYTIGVTSDDVLSDDYCDSFRPTPLQRGSRSQFVRFFDANNRYVVGVHRYLQPDGTIGAGHRLDPKYLVMRTYTYFI